MSDGQSRLLPNLEQKTKPAIQAALDVLAAGNANTVKAIVE